MDLLAVIGLLTILYFVVYILILLSVDCDLELAWNERFGKRIDSLAGSVIWITGASSGIGEHLAFSLAASGAKLVLSARREAELQKVKRECCDRGHGVREEDILVLPFDVTDHGAHQACFDKVIQEFGTLDVLINNAGRSQRAKWEEIDLLVDKEMFDLNVFSVIALSRIAVRYFLKKGSGHIVVTSSVAGLFPMPYSATYCGSKYALHGYLNCLSMEIPDKKIYTTLLCPGPTFSNFLSECFTGTPGEKFGQSMHVTDKRMKTERCAKLCSIAIANKQREAWIGIFPVMFLCYLQYFPNIGQIIMTYIGPKRFMKFRDSKDTMKTE